MRSLFRNPLCAHIHRTKTAEARKSHQKHQTVDGTALERSSTGLWAQISTPVWTGQWLLVTSLGTSFVLFLLLTSSQCSVYRRWMALACFHALTPAEVWLSSSQTPSKLHVLPQAGNHNSNIPRHIRAVHTVPKETLASGDAGASRRSRAPPMQPGVPTRLYNKKVIENV